MTWTRIHNPGGNPYHKAVAPGGFSLRVYEFREPNAPRYYWNVFSLDGNTVLAEGRSRFLRLAKRAAARAAPR